MYINQRSIAGWEKKGCGIACVAMALERAGVSYRLEDVTTSLLAMDGYLPSVGWKHKSLARELQNYFVSAYTQEFTHRKDSSFLSVGLNKINKELAKGNIVLVSILRGFNPQASATHLVVITGVENDTFVIDDPDYANETGSGLRINKKDFARVWRGYCIFVELDKPKE